MKIETVSAKVILPLRRDILRPGYSLEESKFEGDSDPDTFHLAAILKEDIIGVATLMKDPYPLLPGTNQYRLRGMAVSEDHQGKGIGKKILIKAIRLMTDKDVDYLWFNARSHAVEFYRKQGFVTKGEEFSIPTVGPHYFMYRKL